MINQKDFVNPLLKWYDKNKREMVWRDKNNPYFTWISEIMLGSLTLVFYLHFPYHLYYSLLRLIFLSNFMIFLVLFCTICVIIRLGLSFVFKSFSYAERKRLSCMLISLAAKTIKMYI